MADVRRSAPPRFVPTLTDVVPAPGAQAAVPVLPPAAPAMPRVDAPLAPAPAARIAPPFLASTPAAPAQAPVSAPAETPVLRLPDDFEEHVVHRVMQRVDVALESRLREAIATVVQEQTRSMVPRLREEVESVVRQAVYEAVADELAGERGAT
jgi:hypothetical protein